MTPSIALFRSVLFEDSTLSETIDSFLSSVKRSNPQTSFYITWALVVCKVWWKFKKGLAKTFGYRHGEKLHLKWLTPTVVSERSAVRPFICWTYWLPWLKQISQKNYQSQAHEVEELWVRNINWTSIKTSNICPHLSRFLVWESNSTVWSGGELSDLMNKSFERLVWSYWFMCFGTLKITADH